MHPLSYIPLSLSEVHRRRAMRLDGRLVEEGSAERSEVGGVLGGTGPAEPDMTAGVMG